MLLFPSAAGEGAQACEKGRGHCPWKLSLDPVPPVGIPEAEDRKQEEEVRVEGPGVSN
jgi:hypothetical protein